MVWLPEKLGLRTCCQLSKRWCSMKNLHLLLLSDFFILCLFKDRVKKAENIKISFEENLVLFGSVIIAATWNTSNSSVKQTRYTYIYAHSCAYACLFVYTSIQHIHTHIILRKGRHEVYRSVCLVALYWSLKASLLWIRHSSAVIYRVLQEQL